MDERQRDVNAPGMGESRRSILLVLKRTGGSTTPALAAALGLNAETIREHLNALTSQGLVLREGTRSHGPGRPEVVYAVSPEAEALFPRREGEILRRLAAFMKESGHETVLAAFFERYVEERREEALARVGRLEGRERLEEAARILSELGFMARVTEAGGEPRLQLCHCPLRELVEVSRIPCRAEVGFVRELVGDRLTRVSYIPAGDGSCTYRKAGRGC